MMVKEFGHSPEGRDASSEVEQYQLNEVQQEQVNELVRQVFLPDQRYTSMYNSGSEPIDTEWGRCLITTSHSQEATKIVQAAIRDEEGDTYFLQHELVDDSPDADDRLHECSDNCFCAIVTPGAELPFHGLDTENNNRVISQAESEEIIKGLWCMCNDVKYADPADSRSKNARKVVQRLQNSAPRQDINLTYHPAFLVAMDKIFLQHYR
jgi:hypothetical protein